MSDHPKPGPEEINIGLEYFFTDTEPLGGVLKKDIDDFIVTEISDPPKCLEDGPITIAKIRAKNWETNRLIKFLSKNLGISRNKIKFAGTKDKRAVTTRLFSFQHPMENVSSLEIPDVEVLEVYMSNRELELGNLIGNHFTINVRDIKGGSQRIDDIVSTCLQQITSTGGFPNYFGVQRFGAIRPITHIVGKNIVHNDLERAVMSYIGNPIDKEGPEAFEARTRIEKERDWEEAVTYYPSNYTFERTMIHHLKRIPGDWSGALNDLPENLRMMFVHAYQSYIFNRIISERLKRGLSLNEPSVGDIIVALNKKGLPEHYNGIRVTSSNLSRMENIVRKRKGFITGAIIGMSSEIASGDMGDIENKIFQQEGVAPEDFKISKISNVSSKGMRRELLSPIFDLKWRTLQKGSEDVLQLDFSLFRGTYATSFMREIIKGNILDY
jgi:tRNA pseudouridine13 synthase